MTRTTSDERKFNKVEVVLFTRLQIVPRTVKKKLVAEWRSCVVRRVCATSKQKGQRTRKRLKQVLSKDRAYETRPHYYAKWTMTRWLVETMLVRGTVPRQGLAHPLCGKRSRDMLLLFGPKQPVSVLFSHCSFVQKLFPSLRAKG